MMAVGALLAGPCLPGVETAGRRDLGPGVRCVLVRARARAVHGVEAVAYEGGRQAPVGALLAIAATVASIVVGATAHLRHQGLVEEMMLASLGLHFLAGERVEMPFVVGALSVGEKGAA